MTSYAFIAHARRHTEREERDLFPGALKALRPSDWASIEARVADARDPRFNAIERSWHSLAEKIPQ